MGVRGLWRLLLPIGRRISIETLEGKILAIDASIWLTQFLKAMRDPETGSVKAAAHLIGFFRRLAKLRFHGIRPVLVFDGETPEIKRREIQRRRKQREQFASTGQAAMQRLAKRLLLEQLKKTSNKSTESGGAYAPGFNVAEEDEPLKTEETSKIFATPNNSHEAIMAEVADLEDEWKEQPNIEEENDWDMAVVEDSSDRDERHSSVYDHTYTAFDVDRISSLPSHARKDAVEEAKRQQRMRSRREFMPVAGKPDEYSQTQLRNFLRSSRLNQEICKMAKMAAGNDDGIGERMASDATRRIIFTKDSDKDQPRSPFKRLQKRFPLTRKLPPEDEDDGEFEWEDRQAATSTAPIPTNESSMRNQSPVPMGAVIEVVDSDDGSSTHGDGGFLPAKEMTVLAKRVICIDDGGSDDDGSGGFTVSENPPNNALQSDTVFAPDRDLDEEEGGGFLPAESVDTRRAQDVDARCVQEIEDEILARALQESESHPSTGMANEQTRNPVQQTAEYSKERIIQIDSDAALAVQLQEIENSGQHNGKAASSKPENDCLNDDEDSAEVDWEDGDLDLDATRDEGESIRQFPHDAHETTHLDLIDVTKKMQASNDNSGDDESVWLVNDERAKDIARTSENRRNEVGRVVNANSHKPSGYQEHDEMHALRSPTKEKRNMSFMEDNDFDIAQVADENALALEHAQATAANLTDWAGRAFRRAIAQHAQQTGTGSPEKKNQSNPKEKNASQGIEDGESMGEESNNEVPPTTPSLKQAPLSSVQTSLVSHEPSQEHATLSESAKWNENQPPVGLLQGGVASLKEQVDLLNAATKRQERDMDTVTDEMKAEVIQLIQLFGIPYVESPAEAEAQCAKLEELGLVDGIVTEDSDVFAFGGKSIYRNIFDDQKYVEAYLAQDAERELALGRNQMVALAMILGSDYSEGVKGVGIVNGMEVLQAFDVSCGVKEGLTKFRKWLDGFDPDDARKKKTGSDEILSAEQKFSVKHKSARTQWTVPANFPADNIMNAYLKPVVDSSSDRFSWGTPDLEKLLVFCQRNMGWEQDDTKKLLEPVLQRLEGSSRQTRLESFFMKYEDSIKFAKVKSKRLREVFQDIHQKSSQDNESSKKRARKKS